MRYPQGSGKKLLAVLLVLGLVPGLVFGQDAGPSPVAEALKKADLAIEKIVAVPEGERTFENTIGAVDAMIVHLRLDTEFLQFLAYVSPDAEVRQKGSKAEEDVRNWIINLTKREDLYKAVKAYADTKPKLEGEQKRLLERSLRDYRRAGMDLSPENREKLKALEIEINKLSLEFEKNIRDDDTKVPLMAEELKGMSEDYLKALPQVAGLYMVGMDYPSFLPVQDYCEVESTRKKTWVAYKRRGGQKNVDLLERILKLRRSREFAGLSARGGLRNRSPHGEKRQERARVLRQTPTVGPKESRIGLRRVPGRQAETHRRCERQAAPLGFLVLRETLDER